MANRRAAAWTAGMAIGAAVLPEAMVAGSPVNTAPLILAGLALLALAAFGITKVLSRPHLIVVIVALAAVAVEAWALRIASSPGAALFTAPLFGIAAAVMTRWPFPSRTWLWAALAAAALVLVRFAAGRDAAALAGVALFAPAVVVATRTTRRLPTWRSVVGALAVGLATAVVFAFLGATTPKANWFGAAISHGPRTGNEVAITFDDGPNVEYTLKVASILQDHGVKGTFFIVGKALEARPDIAAQLLADGEVLGDHSYHHDAVSWLRPDYPEIPRTQAVFQRDLGLCPALFRPPHGTRTPFMAHKASSAGMKMVMWDDSAADWATTDGQLVAQRILSGVRPGSIILLHDGIDGDLAADRSVVLTALPIILDGLRAKGLKPVTVPELLGVPAYAPC